MNEIVIREAARVRDGKGRLVYEAGVKPGVIEVMVNFPTIIEADVPAQVGAVIQSMTLGNKAGEVIGIDQKEGVRLLYRLVGTENSEEILEAQFPDTGPDAYDPLRKPEPIVPEGQLDPATGRPIKQAAVPAKEAREEIAKIRNAMSRLAKAVRVWEASNEGE